MAAGNTYVALATYTLGSAVNSVTFSAISGAYTDLVLVVSGSATTNNTSFIQFNSDTGTNYSNTQVYGDGSGAASNRQSSATSSWLGEFYTNSNLIVQIMNYANATTYKTFLARANTPSNYAQLNVGLWRSTSAITSVTAFMSGAITFVIGTTFSLYGIAAA